MKITLPAIEGYGVSVSRSLRRHTPDVPARVILFVAVTLTATCGRAQAARGHGRFDLFVEGGGSFFTPKTAREQIGYVAPPIGPVVADETTSLADSGRLFLGGDFWFTRHDGVQVSYSYNPGNVAVTTAPIQPPVNGGSAFFTPRVSTISFDYLRSFAVGRRWSLFLAAGAGRLWRTRGASGSFVANLGFGAEFAITRRWAARAEYRDYLPYPAAGFASGWVHEHVPTIGIVYRF